MNLANTINDFNELSQIEIDIILKNINKKLTKNEIDYLHKIIEKKDSSSELELMKIICKNLPKSKSEIEKKIRLGLTNKYYKYIYQNLPEHISFFLYFIKDNNLFSISKIEKLINKTFNKNINTYKELLSNFNLIGVHNEFEINCLFELIKTDFDKFEDLLLFYSFDERRKYELLNIIFDKLNNLNRFKNNLNYLNQNQNNYDNFLILKNLISLIEKTTFNRNSLISLINNDDIKRIFNKNDLENKLENTLIKKTNLQKKLDKI